MKKLIAFLMILAVLLCFAGCAKQPPANDAATDKIRLVYIVNGTLGDKSFFDSGKEGLDMINEKYGDKFYTEVREMSYDTSVWESTALDIASEGWDIIVLGTWDMMNIADQIATKYPDSKLWFFDEMWDFEAMPHDNIYDMFFAQNEGSYLVGMAAAMASKTGKISFMGGYENTVLRDFAVGYTQGAKSVNPDIEVNVSWTQSFSDSSVGKDISLGLYQQGFDVVFACCGNCGLGAFDAVVEMGDGHYVIGVDGDQGAYWTSLGETEKANATITSMQKNVNNGFLRAAELHLNGKCPYGENEKLGLAVGGVGFAITDATESVLGKENLAEMAKTQENIISGTIIVDSAF